MAPGGYRPAGVEASGLGREQRRARVLEVRGLLLAAGPRAGHDHAAARALHLRGAALLCGAHPAVDLGLAARRVAEVDAERHAIGSVVPALRPPARETLSRM